MSLLDFIFPKRCVNCKKKESYFCEGCFVFLSFDAKKLCLVCDRPSFNSLTHPKCASKYSIDGCFSALSYNKAAQKLIYSFKYKPYLLDLKSFLSDLFYESIIQDENFSRLIKSGKWQIVPIPLSGSKLKSRGYNQAEVLSKELSKKLNTPFVNVLKRTKNTKTQVGMTSNQRKENIKDAFQINTQMLSVRGQMFENVFLVDDIVTTGSTLNEAAKVLKKQGIKQVFGLTLARD